MEKKQVRVYEGLLSIYNTCGKVGHIKENCTLGPNKQTPDKPNMLMKETTTSVTPSEVGKTDDQGLYGPWMQVPNCRNKKQPAVTRNGGRLVNQTISSSQRFGALVVQNLEDSLQEPTTFLPHPMQEANGYSRVKKGKEIQG